MNKDALQEELPSTWKVLEERAPQFLNLCGDFRKRNQKALVGERPRKT